MPITASATGQGISVVGEPIQPLPRKLVDASPKKVALGEKLFLDPLLSKNGTVSCARCHPLNHAGVDGLRYSVGINGGVGSINAPTVYNSGLNFLQFWDGRASTLEEQINGPLQNPLEMGNTWAGLISTLSGVAEYQKAFSEVYGGHPTPDRVRDAIATFERTLLTPDDPFDRYLRGDKNAIGADEKAGYALFKSYGCSSCHQGRLIGGNMYEKMGILGDYFKDRGNVQKVDFGRYNLTGVEKHRYEFKVPSLRNIALTAPYFHDGSASTLAQAVDMMARYQLGRPMPDHDRELIIAFLKSLTGRFKVPQQ